MAGRDSERYATSSVSEGKISGITPVFTDREHFGKLRLASRDNGDGTTDYSLESPMTFNRLGISKTLTNQLDINDAGWSDVQKGLKRISYPHRVIERMSRSARNLTHLRTIQHDAGSLADSMLEHNVTWNHMPVFQFGETRKYAADRLRELDKDLLKIIVEQLFGVTISSKMMRKWTPQQWNRRTPAQRQELLDVFRTVLSAEVSAEDQISTEELLDCLMSAELEELEHIAAEQLFDRFTIEKDLAWNPDDHMGPPPSEIYVRDADIPRGVSRDKNTTVVLGRHLPPKNKQETLERRRVEFWTERPERVVQPVLRWKRDDRDGEPVRSFRFGGGESHLQYDNDELTISYRSPLMGAAMAAINFGAEAGYDDALRRYFSVPELSRKHAGLLPLVLKHKQNEVLDNSYIRVSEKLVDEYAH